MPSRAMPVALVKLGRPVPATRRPFIVTLVQFTRSRTLANVEAKMEQPSEFIVQTRIFGFVAAEADVAVLIASRSKHLNLMVRWDLASDTFEVGQWLARQIDLERSELSPDGRLFGYYALNSGRKPSGGPHPGHYIVVCRPPYFTALSLWWTGGKQADRVIWTGNRQISVGKPAGTPPDTGRVPEDFRVIDPADIWVRRSVYPNSMGGLVRKGLRFPEVSRPEVQHHLWRRRLDWNDVDHRGRLLFARGGRVFAWGENGKRELIDLNPQDIQPLAPPAWATEWP